MKVFTAKVAKYTVHCNCTSFTKTNEVLLILEVLLKNLVFDEIYICHYNTARSCYTLVIRVLCDIIRSVAPRVLYRTKHSHTGVEKVYNYSI